MRTSAKIPLSEAAYAVLRDVTIIPISLGAVKIACYHAKINSGQLARPLYEEVNEVLTRIGGQWKGGKTAAHLFDAEVDPRRLLDAVIESRVMPDKNPYAFFPTPAPVILQMIAYAQIGPMFFPEGYKPRLLEPSAGRGAMAEMMQVANPEADIDCIEINPINCAYLVDKGLKWFCSDFLHYCRGNVDDKEPIYDGVMMNPPFQGAEYVKHILHAWALLKPGRILVAIAPSGLISGEQKQIAGLRDLVNKHGCFTAYNGEDAFKESGTGVSTCMIFMEKPDEDQTPVARLEEPAEEAPAVFDDPFADDEDPFSDESFAAIKNAQPPEGVTLTVDPDGALHDPLPAADAPAAGLAAEAEPISDDFAEPVWEEGFIGVCKKHLWTQTTLLHNALTSRKNREAPKRDEKAMLREWDFVQAAEPGWRPTPKSKAGYGFAIQYEAPADPGVTREAM